MKPIGSIAKIRELLNSSGFRIKKHLGQNFLADANILDAIVEKADIGKETDVVEVGPGLGSLTEKLLDFARGVLAYEIDAELVEILGSVFSDRKNLTLLQKDILKADIDEDIEKTFGSESKVVVVANLPYYITTPVIMRFLETSKRTQKLILMMQAEVAQRIVSKPATKDYNALTVVIRYQADVRLLLKVPRSVFIPAPNVDSAVIAVTRKEQPDLRAQDEPFFFRFVHEAFRQRRKTLSNNLLQAFPELTRDTIDDLIRQTGIEPSARAEVLPLETFVRLADSFWFFQKQQKEK